MNADRYEKYLTPLAVGLGIIFIASGLYLGLKKKNKELTQLPSFSPIAVSVNPTPTTKETTAPGTNPVNSPSAQNRKYTANNQTEATTLYRIPEVKGLSTAAPLPVYSPLNELPFYVPQTSLPAFRPQFSLVTTPNSPLNELIHVSFVINDKTVLVGVPAGSTVLGAMNAARAQKLLTFMTQSFSGLGEKVIEINGQAEGGGHFWLYTVNGTFATVGISSQAVNDGDVVAWSLS